MAKILVTGGCGYIGSHTIVDLLDNGFEVVSVDSLIRADERILDGVEAITGKRVHNYAVDLCDLEALKEVFKAEKDIVGVVHFAALKSVPESVVQPLRYFHNNINSLLNVLQCMREQYISHFIFSSSCSVYGNADELPVTEDTPWKVAESPYARTKQIGEWMVQDFSQTHSHIRSILLRYFNPGGAHESAKIGEVPQKGATNLVPIIVEVAQGKRQQLTVFGSDYDTRDGSCVRDYIHVMDLARAHTASLKYLMEEANEHSCEVFNIGIGEGVTVLEAINAFEKVAGQKLNYSLGTRRAGDVEAIYANYEKAAARLGWQPQRSIEDIMRSAWDWARSGSPLLEG